MWITSNKCDTEYQEGDDDCDYCEEHQESMSSFILLKMQPRIIDTTIHMYELKISIIFASLTVYPAA